MGGGGGYVGRSLTDRQERLAKKEAEAKRILEQERAARRNVFISFAAEDIDEVNLLRGQARSGRSPIEFVDRSVRVPFDSTRAEYIRQRITERIRQSSMSVVFLSDNTSKSKWVDWEIRKSLELGKRVVAVHAGESAPRALPSAAVESRIPIIPWRDLKSHLRPD